MEFKFKNTCIQNARHLTELARATAGKKLALIGILPAVIIIAGIVIIIREGFGITAGLFLIAAFTVITVMISAPRRVANETSKRNRKQYGQDISVTLTFLEEEVKAHNHQQNVDASIPYEEIVKITETRSLYLLVLKRGMALMVQKDGFTFGKAEDFLPFIREKTGVK